VKNSPTAAAITTPREEVFLASGMDGSPDSSV
jgi:hypothetical protein